MKGWNIISWSVLLQRPGIWKNLSILSLDRMTISPVWMQYGSNKENGPALVGIELQAGQTIDTLLKKTDYVEYWSLKLIKTISWLSYSQYTLSLHLWKKCSRNHWSCWELLYHWTNCYGMRKTGSRNAVGKIWSLAPAFDWWCIGSLMKIHGENPALCHRFSRTSWCMWYVALVANIRGHKSHQHIGGCLTVLQKTLAPAALVVVRTTLSDGAGIAIQTTAWILFWWMPETRRTPDSFGNMQPYGFLPREIRLREECRDILNRSAEKPRLEIHHEKYLWIQKVLVPLH